MDLLTKAEHVPGYQQSPSCGSENPTPIILIIFIILPDFSSNISVQYSNIFMVKLNAMNCGSVTLSIDLKTADRTSELLTSEGQTESKNIVKL